MIQAHDKPRPHRTADPKATGLAHGLAGSIEFMLTYAAQTGDALAFAAAAARRTRQFAEQGTDRSNASWAAGLTGLLAFFRRLAAGTP
ncbi:MAG: hypothetical protein ABSB76_11150 [Streptosporangiaceae bacterium]|jgi:hypothetical protein